MMKTKTIHLNVLTHKKLKFKALRDGTTIGKLIEDILEKELGEELEQLLKAGEIG